MFSDTLSAYLTMVPLILLTCITLWCGKTIFLVFAPPYEFFDRISSMMSLSRVHFEIYAHIQSHLKEKEMQEGTMIVWETAEKEEKQKAKEKEKDTPNWMQSSKE